MTTTQLIKLLKSVEYGASGRPREISFYREDEDGERNFMSEPYISIDGTGDGVAGAELILLLKH
jgi:hypothetical protein